MKLRWPLWAIATAWFLLWAAVFISFPHGSPLNITKLGLIPCLIIYAVYCAFAQSVGYGVIVGKKTRDAWKEQHARNVKDLEGHSYTLGYIGWLLIPVIIYLPFLLVAISER